VRELAPVTDTPSFSCKPNMLNSWPPAHFARFGMMSIALRNNATLVAQIAPNVMPGAGAEPLCRTGSSTLPTGPPHQIDRRDPIGALVLFRRVRDQARSPLRKLR